MNILGKKNVIAALSSPSAHGENTDSNSGDDDHDSDDNYTDYTTLHYVW